MPDEQAPASASPSQASVFALNPETLPAERE